MEINLNEQKTLALTLLEWHGGQGSAIYAVGSSLLAGANQKRTDTLSLIPKDLVIQAVYELKQLKKRAKYPEAVTESDEQLCFGLAMRLQKIFGLDNQI